jgi:hypothetical protein
MKALLLLLLLLAPATCLAQSCSQPKNVNGVCNPSCTDPTAPYCFASGTSAGDVCGPAHPALTKWTMCDCPANQTIQRWAITQVATWGHCVKIPSLGLACSGDAQCSFAPDSFGTGYNGTCVNNVCAACSPTDPAINATFTCPSGSPCPPCSRPGLQMRCNANGFWDVSGSIDVSSEVGRVATTTPAATGGNTSSAASRVGLSGGSTGWGLALLVFAELAWHRWLLFRTMY